MKKYYLIEDNECIDILNKEGVINWYNDYYTFDDDNDEILKRGFMRVAGSLYVCTLKYLLSFKETGTDKEKELSKEIINDITAFKRSKQWIRI